MSTLLILCALGVGPVPDYRPVAELVARLGDLDDDSRLRAAFELRQRGPAAAQAVPALIVALHDRKAEIRQEAAFALGRIGAPAKPAIPALVAALKDEDPVVRFWGVSALTSF